MEHDYDIKNVLWFLKGLTGGWGGKLTKIFRDMKGHQFEVFAITKRK